MDSSHNHSVQRKTYLDVLRILSIILVLFNHTNTKGYALCVIATESPLFPFYLACSAFCKIAVPVFLMISGALLLKKEEPISTMLKKRCLRMLIALILASFVTYLFLLHRDYPEFSFLTFLKHLYSAKISTPLWYVYAYIAFLLTLPFLRRMSKDMMFKEYAYLTVIITLVSVLEALELLLFDNSVQYASYFDLFTTSRIVYYPLMGDFLANKLPDSKLTKKNMIAVGLIGIISLLTNCWLTCKWCDFLGGWEYSTFETHISRFVFFPSIALFLFMRYLFLHIQLNVQIEKAITYVGSCTFGIYLFEKIYREITLPVFDILSLYLPRFVACIIWILAAFLLGLAVTSFIRQIPVLKKII